MFLPRASSVFDNPIYFASFLVLPFFFTLMLASKKSEQNRIIYWTYTFCIFLGIFFTYTRGALLGLACGLLIYVFLTLKSSKRAKKALTFIAFAMIVLGLIPLLSSQNTRGNEISDRLLSFRDASAMDRFIYWKIGMLGWMDRPLLGLGPENYSYAYTKYFEPQLDYQGVFNNKPHNQFVEILTTTGLVGFLITIAIYLFAFNQLLTLKEPEIRKLGITALAAYAVQNFFIYDTISALLVFYGFLAWIAMSPVKFEEDKNNKTMSKILIPVASFIGVGCVLFFILLPSVQEFMDLAKSKHSNLSLSEQANLLRQSLDRSYVYSYSAIGERVIALHLELLPHLSEEQKQDLQNLDAVGIRAFQLALKKSPDHLERLYYFGYLSYQSAIIAHEPVSQDAIDAMRKAINLSPLRPEPPLLLEQMTEHNNNLLK